MNANEDTGPGPGRLTPYTRLDEVLAGHASTLRSVLGDTFVGLYPLGSLAIGDFDLTSDVDFMVVTSDELDPAWMTTYQPAAVRAAFISVRCTLFMRPAASAVTSPRETSTT